jgi:TolB-like protein
VQVSDKTIAVLPFENLGAEKEDGFFADGIRDDVLTTLGKIKEPTASRALRSRFIAARA